MTALGQERTLGALGSMSAIPPTTDIGDLMSAFWGNAVVIGGGC